MPGDNATSIAPGINVNFPQNGPNSGTGIVRISDSAFNLTEPGTYQIFFEVPVNQAGQLQLTLNGMPIDYAVFGRATGASSIIGMALVTTTIANSTVNVRNPVANPSALIITPSAGGTLPVSAHLIIIRLQ